VVLNCAQGDVQRPSERKAAQLAAGGGDMYGDAGGGYGGGEWWWSAAAVCALQGMSMGCVSDGRAACAPQPSF